ncbi:MAG: hypothetical protein Q9162_000444 [Coniocarpon cinnabarinum]
MDAAEAPSSFFRVDECNDQTEPDDAEESVQQNDGAEETWPVDAGGLQDAQGLPNPPTDDMADTGQPAASGSPGRPMLRRDQWAPAPQNPPPLAPSETAVEEGDVATDSLSMAQLRRIVQEMPKKEATPYAFEYSDTSSFEEEVEELFEYSREERKSLELMAQTFSLMWETWQLEGITESTSSYEGSMAWSNAQNSLKEGFLRKVKDDMLSNTHDKPCKAPAALAYLVLGCWRETADENRKNVSPSNDSTQSQEGDASHIKDSPQVTEMKSNILLVTECVGIGAVFDAMKSACAHLLYVEQSDLPYIELTLTCISPDSARFNEYPSDSPASQSELYRFRCCTVVLYLFFDYAKRLNEQDPDHTVTSQCSSESLKILHHLTDLLAHLRWSEYESPGFPLLKALCLLWKIVLFAFGGTKDAERIKESLSDDVQTKGKDGEYFPQISTSPLDYHLFRQEITSKYPAFDPPQPLFPFEAETTSMIPQPQDHARSDSRSENVGLANVNGGGSSIFHQPVHIATPAPSPPPSPAGPGGKGIKKQNYQTNQLFPFLYPPLDDTSNSIGGKGGTELQDLLVGRKWEGRDIPTSILEAADIFASRMRASRALKQLWDERVRFIKYERGYLDSSNDQTEDLIEGESTKETTGESVVRSQTDAMADKLDEESRKKLASVEKFYSTQLPRLQSVVIVLLKVLLQTVTTLVTQPNAPNGLQTGFESPEHRSQDKPKTNGDGATDAPEEHDAGVENINNIRNQEIMGKAVSGTLLLLLKWFKLSHILKFEYLTQLLLDSNYVQLVLKLFTHQELERAVNVKYEKPNLNFFAWCRRNAAASSTSSEPNSASDPPTAQPDPEDDAVPPPIPRSATHVQTETSDPLTDSLNTTEAPLTAMPPEVDELGFSTSSPPPQPITSYSWRTFFSSINFLRILQKIVKSKPHRQLLMVQYKYSNILKKSLKVPQPDVRLYTLKIIKGQVPYCHRKWRQSNMRIITAIYLHCKPELRDDWLAGLTMEEEMGEALPQEQALRSLTYWFNLRRYPEGMTGEGKEKARGLMDEEQDFFVRELEGMEAHVGDNGMAGNPDSVGLPTGRPEAEVDPLDPTADLAGWSKEEREVFWQRTREIMEAEERSVLTKW